VRVPPSRAHRDTEGSFLLAEADGQLVAAAPLYVDELLNESFQRAANIRELLRLRQITSDGIETRLFLPPEQPRALS
jgi:hypothetical protein